MNNPLAKVNVAWLRQAVALVEQMDDVVFSTCPPGMAPHRVGSHLRHILDFYECFLDGIDEGRVDYDARRRNRTIETNRAVACALIRQLAARIEVLATAGNSIALLVHVEDSADDAWLESTVGRELQALSSHTVHHFALISMTMRLHGADADPDFGMSPSTLSYQATKALEAA